MAPHSVFARTSLGFGGLVVVLLVAGRAQATPCPPGTAQLARNTAAPEGDVTVDTTGEPHRIIEGVPASFGWNVRLKRECAGAFELAADASSAEGLKVTLDSDTEYPNRLAHVVLLLGRAPKREALYLVATTSRGRTKLAVPVRWGALTLSQTAFKGTEIDCRDAIVQRLLGLPCGLAVDPPVKLTDSDIPEFPRDTLISVFFAGSNDTAAIDANTFPLRAATTSLPVITIQPEPTAAEVPLGTFKGPLNLRLPALSVAAAQLDANLELKVVPSIDHLLVASLPLTVVASCLLEQIIVAVRVFFEMKKGSRSQEPRPTRGRARGDLPSMPPKEPLSPRARESLERIKRSGEDLLGLINDVLEPAKAEAAGSGQEKHGTASASNEGGVTGIGWFRSIFAALPSSALVFLYVLSRTYANIRAQPHVEVLTGVLQISGCSAGAYFVWRLVWTIAEHRAKRLFPKATSDGSTTSRQDAGAGLPGLES